MGGNHDFSIPNQIPSVSLDLPAAIHVEHGDRADDSLGYRFVRLALQSFPFSALMAILRPRHGFAFLKWLAGDQTVPRAQ